MPDDQATGAFRQYRCHKLVHAAVIKSYTVAPRDRVGYLIEFEDGGDVLVPHEFFARGPAQPGDYVVRYDDGYLSWSPKAVFEAGYAVAA